MSDVFIEKCESYNEEELELSMKKIFESLGDLSFLKNKKILLKPNLLSPKKPEKAVTTNPEFLRAVVKNLKKYTDRIYVGDSSGIGSPDLLYNVTGIKKIIEDENLILADFKNKIKIENPQGKLVKSFEVAKAFADADYIISLPKLKTHAMTYYTGAVKNLFGMIPGGLKPTYHMRFPELGLFTQMLVDLNTAIKPLMSIMDAVIGMEGNGPGNGSPRKIGLIMASYDPVALDSTACRIIGIKPEKIYTNINGVKSGLGVMDSEKIKLPEWFSFDKYSIKDFKKASVKLNMIALPVPKPLTDFVKKTFGRKPQFDHKKCIMCQECVKICPSQPKSLKAENGKIKIDRNTCIKCFCCQEMCPVGAIKPSRFVGKS